MFVTIPSLPNKILIIAIMTFWIQICSLRQIRFHHTHAQLASYLSLSIKQCVDISLRSHCLVGSLVLHKDVCDWLRQKLKVSDQSKLELIHTSCRSESSNFSLVCLEEDLESQNFGHWSLISPRMRGLWKLVKKKYGYKFWAWKTNKQARFSFQMTFVAFLDISMLWKRK